jgi:AcrR family transcriptional regulator
MPKLWTDTIEAHRRQVQGAILDATAALAAEHGLRSVTMSQIAEQVGIGRATLYKYFPDVATILTTWHERQLTGHLAQLTKAAAQAEGPYQRLELVLETYALIQHQFREAHRSELAAHLHRAAHVASAQQQLRELVRDLVASAATAGPVRGDVAADELAAFCLHALAAAAGLPSKAAVQRLVQVTLAGLRPPSPATERGRGPKGSS